MKHLHKLLPFLLLFVCFPSVSAHWQHPVINHSRKDYQGGTQNWMISQHDNGWIYVANNKGLLEYDGVSWNRYPMGNVKSRSVQVGSDGKVYIGGMGEFGYFTPNALGGLTYTNLSDSISRHRYIGIIWNIHQVGDVVYFQSERTLFRWDGSDVTFIPSPSEIRHSAVFNNRFYIANAEGICLLNGDTFSLQVNTSSTASYKIVGLFPLGEDLLVVTARDGLFVYKDSSLKPYRSAADPFLRANPLFCAAVRDSLLALGSVQDGVLIMDMAGGKTEKISIDRGLQNKTVLGMAFDREGDLWLGLDNGLDCVQLTSSLFSLYGNTAVIGSGYASIPYQRRMYLGTNQGLYHMPLPDSNEPESEMIFVPGTSGQVWSLEVYDDKLFCAADNGLFIIDDRRSTQIPGTRGIWSVVAFDHREDVLLAGSYSGLYVLKNTQGQWQVSHRIDGFLHSCKTLFAESPGVVWVANKGQGIFRITLSDDLTQILRIKNYSHPPISPSYDSHITRMGDEIVLVTHAGLYRYDQIRDEIERYGWLEKLLQEDQPCTYIHQDTYGDIWYVVESTLKLIRFDRETGKFVRKGHESYLKGSMIEYFEDIRLWKEDQAVVGTEDGFSLLRFRESSRKHSPVHLQIRKVYLSGGKDSLIYGRNYQYDEQSVTIPYTHNSLRIEYSAANFDPSQASLYTYRLTGPTTDEWSDLTENVRKEYTGLREGTYTFLVRLMTQDGVEPVQASFSFVVLPPWYRTWWAYVLYAVAGMGFFCYLYRRLVRSRKLLLQQKELEMIRQQQEFREQSALKDEKIDLLRDENLRLELQHKADELIRTTLNIMRKNEVLQAIRKEAVGITGAVKEENLVAIRRKVLRLIGQIDSNLEHDNDLAQFQTTFDSVHRDFFRTLDRRFPDLNKKDKMLCAYIRMDLLSKEIAPLLNVSVRGVEISRYRLRKKLKLAEKENLAEFLHRISG
ncbi:MAG: transcriptional regulator [Bacteroides sp.]|nr:transcriptional regulator [Bacteroides sp.]